METEQIPFRSERSTCSIPRNRDVIGGWLIFSCPPWGCVSLHALSNLNRLCEVPVPPLPRLGGLSLLTGGTFFFVTVLVVFWRNAARAHSCNARMFETYQNFLMSWLIHPCLRVVQLCFLTERTNSHLFLQIISITRQDRFPGPRVQQCAAVQYLVGLVQWANWRKQTCK